MVPLYTALLLVMAGLIALVTFELTGDAEHDRPVGPSPPRATEILDPPALPDLALGPLSGMDQTSARPLFRHDRRPPEIAPAVEAPRMRKAAKAPQVAPAPAPVSAPVFRHALSAIVIADGDAFAYLRKAGEAGLERLRPGETIDGWRLEEVRRDSVLLTHGPTRTELELRPAEPSVEPGSPVTTRRGSSPPGGALPPSAPQVSRPRNGDVSAGNVRPDSVEPGPEPPSSRRPARGLRRESLERALRRATRTHGTDR